MTCIRVFEGVDVLDVAIHERLVACYDNDNVVGVWCVDQGRKIKHIDLRVLEGVDEGVMSREVKVAVWGDIVCLHGFADSLAHSVKNTVQNSVFLVLSLETGKLVHTLSEPAHHRREEYDSTSYPTVLALYDGILVSRGVRCHELCVWSTRTGQLLYRLSESSSVHALLGSPPPDPNEVITDFTLDPRGTFVMCTVENEGGEVYVLAWDFESGVGGGERGKGVRRKGERERGFERRSLEDGGGGVEFEYTNFWLCYEM
ncbi:hypothetical protein HK104_008925 [Borealophlyctis nickersoniae]|nr:hypothetical protein HK104_008925 [Borealophlyctis nickersoniae]